MHTTRTAVALGAALLCAATACGSDAGSSEPPTNSVVLSLTATGCSPTALTARAGLIAFAVDNATAEQAEFEIISAKPEILVEKFLEAGTPGSYPVALAEGEYETICGRPSNTRATLIVGEGDGADVRATTRADPAELEAATAQYRTDVAAQVASLQTGTKQFTDAVRAGDTGRRRRSTPPSAGRGSESSPWPSCSPTAMGRSTLAPTTSSTPRPTHSSPAFTPSNTACGSRARSAGPPSTCRSWPTGWTATSPTWWPRSARSRSSRRS